MFEHVSESDGHCECCESGGYWSSVPGSTSCGGCGHSYGSHK